MPSFPRGRALLPRQTDAYPSPRMKTAALTLLLLLMLAPRLAGAMLPHGLACAGMAAADAAATSVHQGHELSANTAPVDDHAGHHQMMAAPAESEASVDASNHSAHHADAGAGDSAHDCQHCGQCDDHCSALLLTALPRQTEPQASRLLLTSTGAAVRGFGHDLNRPPRTASL